MGGVSKVRPGGIGWTAGPREEWGGGKQSPQGRYLGTVSRVEGGAGRVDRVQEGLEGSGRLMESMEGAVFTTFWDQGIFLAPAPQHSNPPPL